jgi:F0F1-type ATP synthase beta subunit
MDHEHLVRRAGAGDVKAFVELMKLFQHFAFGSALALVRDFQRAENPGVDVLTARSRLLDENRIGADHIDVARRGRKAIARLRAATDQSGIDSIEQERARKLQAFFSPPFFAAEP